MRIFNKTFEAFALSLGLETLEISNGQGYDKRRLTEGLQTGKRRPAPLYLSAFGIFLIIKEIQKVYEFFYQGKSLLQKIEHSAEDYFRSFKAGEELGFNYFFHLYFKPLVHFAYSIVNSLQAAEDVVEDSFIKLWEKREAIEAPGLKSYLYASVRNGCIDLLRRNDHHEAYLNNMAEKPEQIAIDISHKIIMTEAMSQVYTALEALPSKAGEIIRLYYVEGRNLNEISQELKLSLPAIKSRKAKALKLLRKQLPYLRYLIMLKIFL